MGFLAAAILVTQLALKGDERTDAMGILGAGLNIIMYASPLAVMVSHEKNFFFYVKYFGN